MSHPSFSLDMEAVYRLLDECRRRLDLSWTEVAAELGITSATLSRNLHKHTHPSGQTLVNMFGFIGKHHPGINEAVVRTLGVVGPPEVR